MNGVPLAPHIYLSTACAHGYCAQCRLRCKYCDALCICSACIHPPSDPGSILTRLAEAEAAANMARTNLARTNLAKVAHGGGPL